MWPEEAEAAMQESRNLRRWLYRDDQPVIRDSLSQGQSTPTSLPANGERDAEEEMKGEAEQR